MVGCEREATALCRVGPTAALLLAWSALPALAAIDLRINKGPRADELTLQWNGGQVPYDVYRSESAWDVTDPINLLGSTNATAWVDTVPEGELHFYLVENPCVPNPPELCDGVDRVGSGLEPGVLADGETEREVDARNVDR